MAIKIGWNPVTQTWDKLFSQDFKEADRRDTDMVRSFKGRKTPLDRHRHDPGNENWEDARTRIYWPWEDNS